MGTLLAAASSCSKKRVVPSLAKFHNMKPFICLFMSCYFFSATAQPSFNQTFKEQILKDWSRAKAYTQEYLDAMPADKYQFKANDSTRSFAEQMLHIAFANLGMSVTATGSFEKNLPEIRRWNSFETSPAMQNKDSVAYYVNASYDFVINAITNLDPGKFTEMVTQRTPGGLRNETRLTWIMKAFEHQTHHRGQCTIYIRLLGIRPPGEKLF
jgi:uncharacterized damage-inducible protein DinB